MNLALVFSMFAEGLISFFTPCILPVLPLYLGYLSSGSKTIDENGNIIYKRLKVFLTTCFFVLGISFAILLLGISVSVFNNIFVDYSLVLSYIGSFLLIIFGLYTLGIISIPLLDRERRIGVTFDLKRLNYFTAYFFGFLFSFSWTPCVGPYLTSAVIMAGSQGSVISGIVYMLIYILGFVIPFLLLGIFLEEFLNFINKRRNVLKYVSIIGGVLILVMGIYMFISSSATILNTQNELKKYQESGYIVYENDKQKFDFELENRNGNTISLSDTEGEFVCITFFRTWCTYCKQEAQDLALLKEEYPDIKFYLITSPGNDSEKDKAGIIKYLDELNCDIEVLFDYDNSLVREYGVSGFPMTFIYNNNDMLYGYVPGYMPIENMKTVLNDLLGINYD